MGLSLFLIDLRGIEGVTVNPIRTMVNHETNELFFDDVRIPAGTLIGEEGDGFRYILDGMNAERILVASECIGDGHWFIERVTRYAASASCSTADRRQPGRPVPDRPSLRQHRGRRPDALERAADLFDAGVDCGAEANMAKLLASEASWEAANCALQYHGGYGFAEEYDIERKFRETRLYQIAPISTNLILAYVGEHVRPPTCPSPTTTSTRACRSSPTPSPRAAAGSWCATPSTPAPCSAPSS